VRVHGAQASRGGEVGNENVITCRLFPYDRVQVTDAKEIHFDGWVLRVSSGELLREGNTQRLAQQPLRMLVELLEHPGEVVTRERLVQVLWPKGIVDFDNSLNALVRKVRVALNDDSGLPRYIETLPRIGYRFIGKVASAPVQPAMPGGPPTPAKNWMRWAGAAIAVVALIAVTFFWWQSRNATTMAEASVTPRAGEIQGRSTNQRAYELYLNAKFHRSRRDVNGNPEAIRNLQAALREDPYFAAAWAALAETYMGSGITQHMPIDEAMKQARTAALRAIELDSKLAAGHSALGTIMLHYDFDYTGAEKELLAARDADDHYSRLWHSYGLLRGYQARTDEAFEYLGRARELEPMTLLFTASYANLLYQTRRYQEAIEYIRPLLASQPRFDQVRAILIRALVETGDIQGALEQLPLRYSDTPVLSDAGLVYAHADRRNEALRELEHLERREHEGYGMSYEIAIVHAALGQIDEACAALRHAPEDHSQTLGWLQLDPRMDPLRKQQCYAEVAQRLYKKG
jgi:DNA-binding winged helix-turn-helix (wHTH) protein/tetratricopeptide (TPR) repeat protein